MKIWVKMDERQGEVVAHPCTPRGTCLCECGVKRTVAAEFVEVAQVSRVMCRRGSNQLAQELENMAAWVERRKARYVVAEDPEDGGAY